VSFDLLQYLLSLCPYGVAISGISSLVQYRLYKLKGPPKCSVVDNMFILPLQSTATVYKINCNEQTAISRYVLHSPLVCQHPHAKADHLQECVDLCACMGGIYVEYELLIRGRITNVDILKTNGGTFLVKLEECEHYIDSNGIQLTHVGIIWLKSVHLETLFNAEDAITIHVKVFAHGIHYEEKVIEEHVTTVLKIVNKIVKDEISERQNANEKLKTFSVFFAFDGDAFANRSFTALLPILYTRMCTYFPSQVRSIQLFAFFKNDDHYLRQQSTRVEER
ncbi:hypothetical protein RFI_28464, partial [Reticulomyxa filosa]